MIRMGGPVGDRQRHVLVVQNDADIALFQEWIAANRTVGFDTETTGLDIYGENFRIRVAQFGNADLGWVIPVEDLPEYIPTVIAALEAADQLYIQNAAFDIQVVAHKWGMDSDKLWAKVRDTMILGHLVDPRGVHEGGTGHKLEEMVAAYIDPVKGVEIKSSMHTLAVSYGTNYNKIWSEVDLWDDTYLWYAGMDPIFSYSMHETLMDKVPKASVHLIDYEHSVARVCMNMERKGFLLDNTYSRVLSEDLADLEEEWAEEAAKFGVTKVGSTDQVAKALTDMGIKITEFTPSGKPKVDKKLLEYLVKAGGESGKLAKAVLEAKKASKWRKTWVDKFLDTQDAEGRCHASIHPLRARTARMSITGIPAQTLPSNDSQIRGCFVADEEEVIVSVDYAAQELRVLASLSGDETMVQAFLNGDDLHQITADAAGVERKVGKMANFLTVYGGGPTALAAQADIDVATAKKVLDAFGKTYPGVRRFAASLEREARRYGRVVTPSGRVLPVDESRAYSALNYVIQSTSRDVTCAALLRLDQAGFGPYMRLPIHDEVLLSIPEDKAESIAATVAQEMNYYGFTVPIIAEADIGRRSWGSLYT